MRGRILYRTSVVVMALVLLAFWSWRVHADSQAVPSWIDQEEQTRLVESLRTALPPGWTVTARASGRVPDEWRSLDVRSFEVEGENRDHVFRVWFLPTDWIGIRQPDPKRARIVYWEGVLMGPKYKSITLADQVSVHDAVHAMGMNTPSLVNSGWASGIAAFRDRLSEVDQHTQDLVHRFCNTRQCADEAAYSLVVLGVPARSLTLDCAEHAVGQAQEMCVSALGYWKGSETVRVLNALVSSPATSARARRSAAFSLGQIADPSSGPALRQGLQITSLGDQDGALSIADAIGRIRYGPAAPNVLARLETERDRFAQMRYAKVLAALRYTPAVPAIEKLCETTNVSVDWIVSKSRHGDHDSLPELALLRIKGPWGQPVDGIRLLLLAPEKPVSSGRIQVAALIENVGDIDVEIMNTAGVWIVDGKEYPNIDTVKWDGNMTLYVNHVDLRSVDLSRVLSSPGTHSIQYRLLGATSNQLTLQVGL